MPINLNTPLSFPIKWDRALLASVVAVTLLIGVGILAKIRVLIALGEVAAVVLLVTTLAFLFISIVRRYTKPTDSQ